MDMRNIRIYIHIPFCVRKCAYCDFLSFPSDADMRSQYLAALKQEIRARLDVQKEPPFFLSSVFFGGGTPTVLSGEELAGILAEIKKSAVSDGNAEISLEANPGTVDEKKLCVLKDAGFNRISIGAQSMNDGNLKLLGRIHDKEMFRKAFDAAGKAGFDNINLDLISGLPGQTVSGWEDELREAVSFGSGHISVYSLELYEDTPLYSRKEEYPWPSDEELARMYERTEKILSEHGLHRYEFSNYAKPGYECRHNTGYWTGDEYLGFGIGAASFENNTRYSNTAEMKAYLDVMKNAAQGGPDLQAVRTGIQKLSEKDLESEYMILGLRLTKGVSVSGFRERFGESMEDVFGKMIRKYLQSGFLVMEEDRLRLAEKALFVSNTILADFML